VVEHVPGLDSALLRPSAPSALCGRLHMDVSGPSSSGGSNDGQPPTASPGLLLARAAPTHAPACRLLTLCGAQGQ